MDISAISLKDLLSHYKTKREMTNFFIDGLIRHFESLAVTYLVAGNSQTFSSAPTVEGNNHEEADSLMVHCIKRLATESSDVVVYSNDTDVSVLLISHSEMLRCHSIVVVWAEDEVLDILSIAAHLGPRKSRALLSFHAITGCDTVEKFHGKGKESWMGVFKNLGSPDIEALISFPTAITADVVCAVEKILCKAYLPKTSKITELKDARWFKFRLLMIFQNCRPPEVL